MPLALLVAALLYLDQYQNGLLLGEVASLREQAKIYAGALGESAVRVPDFRHLRNPNPVLVADLARPLLRRLTEPTPYSVARLYGPDGRVVADSNPASPNGEPPLPPPSPRRHVTDGPIRLLGLFYDRLLALLPAGEDGIAVTPVRPPPSTPTRHGPPPRPSNDVREQVQIGGGDDFREIPPYIRRTRDNRLLVTVAEPVQHDGRTVGIILLTRSANEVDHSLDAVRRSILDLFLLALLLTVLLSIYLTGTVARPILSLARAARTMREGRGRTGAVPANLRRRTDEIGALAVALDDSARALWARMDAIERFAADVSHEIKNPLSSMSSAIETLGRIENPAQRARLLAIIGDDVSRLDRLISDISTASRVDAELSRTETVRVPILPMMQALVDIHEATRDRSAPVLLLEARSDPAMLVVAGVEDRIVQVLRNLLGNAVSFSPPEGRILLAAEARDRVVVIVVADEGPGIPEAKLEHIFDRFYSERPVGEEFGRHSGLGLSISRQIVDALGGRISAANRVDRDGHVLGARFTVELPRAGV